MSNTAPLGYKRVEYLESTGTQYIDTGIKPTISQKYEIKYSVSDITTNQVIFGTRTSGIFQTSTNQIYLNINDNKKRFFAGNIVTENNIQINIIQTDIFTANSGNYDSTGTKNFFIFVLNNIDTPSAFSTARIYSFKIYDNNVLVRDYIPVLNENNEAGLYDLVNKEFYGNSGTGSFQYGNIIPEGTIAEKFNYSLETKELIKDGINYLGGNVTDETTLKEYRDELDSVYAKLPKVSNSTASDNVILYPTLKGRIDSTLKGQIGQDTTNGNQLIDFASKVATGYSFENDTLIFESSQQDYAGVQWNITDLVKNNPNKKIYFSYEDIDISNQLGTIVRLQVIYNDGTSPLFMALLNHSLVHSIYTIPADTSNIDKVYIQIYSNNSSDATTSNSVKITKPQLQFGETALPYEKYTGGISSPNPNYEQPVKCVTGENTVRVRGKNLFDKNNANINNNLYIHATERKFYTAETNNRKVLYIKCKENTNYIDSKIASTYFRVASSLNVPWTGESTINQVTGQETATSIKINTR